MLPNHKMYSVPTHNTKSFSLISRFSIFPIDSFVSSRFSLNYVFLIELYSGCSGVSFSDCGALNKIFIHRFNKSPVQFFFDVRHIPGWVTVLELLLCTHYAHLCIWIHDVPTVWENFFSNSTCPNYCSPLNVESNATLYTCVTAELIKLNY